MPKRKNSNGDVIDLDSALSKPIIARRILLYLIERQPELKATVAALAREIAGSQSMEDLAEEIADALNRISAGDVYMTAGRSLGGYRELDESAVAVLSKPLEPHFERLEKLLVKKDESAALIMSEAIILALYRFKYGDEFSKLEECAEDFPEETADWAARLWRSDGNVEWAGVRRFVPDRTIPTDFVKQYVPEWGWLLRDD
jgi:hypothetical protein